VHPRAQLAAEAAEAAAEQGAFWEYYDALLAHQDDARHHQRLRLSPRRREATLDQHLIHTLALASTAFHRLTLY
jgi:hypothetical protein